jgi:hypothetical protein
MGVDYSVSYGYGLAFEEEPLPAPLEGMDTWENDIPNWLEANGFDEIGYTTGGNMMSGPTYCFFYAKGTENLDLEHYEIDGLYDFALRVSFESQKQLEHLAQMLDFTGSIGWKLLGNIH